MKLLWSSLTLIAFLVLAAPMAAPAAGAPELRATPAAVSHASPHGRFLILARAPNQGCNTQCGVDDWGITSCQKVCSRGEITPAAARQACTKMCGDPTLCRPKNGHPASAECRTRCIDRCIRKSIG